MYREYKRLLEQITNNSNINGNKRWNEHEDRKEHSKIKEEKEMVPESRTRPPPQPPPCQTPNNDKHMDIDPVFLGDVTTKYPALDRIVRIFTSSTFTDTMNERNTLMKRSYPKLKSYCQERGYEFQVVDMRWGVRDEATDDHMGTDLCLQELEKCQKISTGPNFVSLLSHKYGYRSLLRDVDAIEFEKILEVVDNENDKKLLQKWFKRDDNSVPCVYVLTSVSQNLPDFISLDREKKMAARNIWWEESEKLQATLSTIAEKLFGPEATRKYIVSVTEKEVQKGVLENSNTESTCLWIKRNITDINDQEPCRLLSRYKECLGDEEKWKESQRLLADLRDRRMIESIPKHRILKYDVNWTDKGIDVDFQQHKDYLEKMCTDFEVAMYDMIDKALERKDNSRQNDTLYEECVQHISFCNEKCRNFQGRAETLSIIKEYVIGSSNAPLVIHGHSGCGKTSLLSITAKQIWSWLDGNCAIILRYIGTTPDSSNIVDLLSSVINQLHNVFGIESEVDKDLKSLSEDLFNCLNLAETKRKIVLILDSLDQFDTTPGVKQLKWLPTVLPENVKIIVSTLEDQKYEYFQTLQRTLESPSCFLKVPDLRRDDVNAILTHWLDMKGRNVTSKQRQLILDAYDKCSLPLFLKLSFEEACRWHSYTEVDDNSLQTTVRKSIDCLFTRVEVMHGQILVSRALGYLTVSKNGLSTSELEDILSCDDDVLTDLYSHWTPPQRRMPPLILVRMKADLDQYFVERGVDGVRVFYWYHRQFIEASSFRYCSKAAMLHTGLADFFSGTWANGKLKPFVDKHGKASEADRFVMSQPLKFGDRYNKRKLNHLPYHMILSGEKTSELKQECLCNFEFLQSKLISTGIRHLLDDFSLANKLLTVNGKKDKQLELIEETLVLSQQALIYDPYQLAPQMMNRLSSHTEELEDFVFQCRKCQSPYIYPDSKILLSPGGQLTAILTGHTDNVRHIDISTDGSLAVTSAYDETVRVWDLQQDKELKTVDGIEEPQKVWFGCNDKKIIIQSTSKILILDHPSWEQEYDIECEAYEPMFCLAGNDKATLVVFHGDSCNLYDLNTRENIANVNLSNEIMFDGRHGHGVMYGSQNFVAVTDEVPDYITILNLKLNSFGPIRRAFKKRHLTVDGMVITKDEQRLIVANCLDNDLHFKDLNTLATLRICKGVTDDLSADYELTRDGQFLYFCSGCNLVVWNLDTYERSVIFEYTDSLSCAKSVDLNTIVTLSDDCVIRKWDLKKNSNSLNKTTKRKILKMETFPNSRYVLCHCLFKDENRNEEYFQVYDVSEKVVVRQALFVDNPPSIHHIVDDRTIAIVTKTDHKLKLIDIDTMTVKLVFEGRTNKRFDDFIVLKQGKEIAVLTKHRKNVKMFETNKAQAKVVLMGGQQERLRDIKANSISTVLVAITDDSTLCLIFNLIASQCIRTLDTKDLQVSELSYYTFLTGSRVGILTITHIPFEEEPSENDPIIDEQSDDDSSVEEDDSFHNEDEEERVVSVWNLDQNCFVGNLMDSEYIARYRTEQYRNDLMKEYSASFEYTIASLDDTRAVSSHEDHILRIWNVQTGELEKRLHGHKSDTRIKTEDSSPYFLTYGEWQEENSLRLWDRETFKCLASFTLDDSMVAVEWLKDGRSFVTTTKSSQIIHWTINNVDRKTVTDMLTYPNLYPNKVCDMALILEHEDDKLENPDDLDTDTDDSENNDKLETDTFDSIGGDDDDDHDHDDDDDYDDEEEEEDGSY